MSDNVRLTDHDKVLAADEIGNVKHLKVKLQYGGENIAVDVSENNPLPVGTTGGNNLAITLGDSPAIDAFGRLRVSNPAYVFENQNQYDAQPLVYNMVTTGDGSSSHIALESTVQLSVGGTLNDKAIRQTKQYFRYQPGKSHLILVTGVLGSAAAGLRRRVGYFDNAGGMFFEQISASEGNTGIKVVIRTNSSDVGFDQSSWNIDKMNGTGASGINLNFTKAQIFLIDLEWLGVGRVRFGFVVNGLIYYCHEVNNSNVVTAVYTTTANLPLRYEIENTANGAAATMKCICGVVISEGGYDKVGYPFAVGKGSTFTSVQTRRPVLSIKPRTTFNSIANRMEFDITGVEITSSTYTSYYEIVYNGVLTNASFANVDTTYSGMQYDITANAITGGIVIGAGYAVAGGPGANATGGIIQRVVKVPLTVNYAGTDADIISVVVTSCDTQTPPRAASVGALISWQELR
jgi:hypothetical protein